MPGVYFRILDYFVVGFGGAWGGLVLCSSRHAPQGNGLPCFGHLVALIAFHLDLDFLQDLGEAVRRAEGDVPASGQCGETDRPLLSPYYWNLAIPQLPDDSGRKPQVAQKP